LKIPSPGIRRRIQFKGDFAAPKNSRLWLTRLGGTQFDLSPDGKRVAVVMPAGVYLITAKLGEGGMGGDQDPVR